MSHVATVLDDIRRIHSETGHKPTSISVTGAYGLALMKEIDRDGLVGVTASRTTDDKFYLNEVEIKMYDARSLADANPVLKDYDLTVKEEDPNGLAPNQPGAKLDANKMKAGVLLDFSRALTQVAAVGTYGANKYSRGGWQSVPEGVTRYSDALMRHLLAEYSHDEPFDPESGLLHAAHMAWNALARLELLLRELEG